jgi:alkylation response protein AidB-like acyl-CoA dehydrogenase
VGAEEHREVNFDLSDEQRLLQDTIRTFLARECPPTHLRALFDAGSHDPALWKGMLELGLGGLHLPDAYGGAGLELLDLALAAEVLGHGGAPGPFFGQRRGPRDRVAGPQRAAAAAPRWAGPHGRPASRGASGSPRSGGSRPERGSTARRPTCRMRR